MHKLHTIQRRNLTWNHWRVVEVWMDDNGAGGEWEAFRLADGLRLKAISLDEEDQVVYGLSRFNTTRPVFLATEEWNGQPKDDTN